MERGMGTHVQSMKEGMIQPTGGMMSHKKTADRGDTRWTTFQWKLPPDMDSDHRAIFILPPSVHPSLLPLLLCPAVM